MTSHPCNHHIPCQATNGVAEVLDKFTDSEFTVEYKYDGERAQVHVMDGGKAVHIFSRCVCKQRLPNVHYSLRTVRQWAH